MRIHIALYKWKDSVTQGQIEKVLNDLVALKPQIPGLLGITCAENQSRYNEGYTHVVFVRGKDQASLDTYRDHPEHAKIAEIIENMEDHGVGVDFDVPAD